MDFLRPKFTVAHTKHDVISILMNKYTYINMYIIIKIILYIHFMLRHNSFIKAEVKICRLRIVKIEKILTVTYRASLPKTTNFLKNGGLRLVPIPQNIKLIQGLYISFSRNRQDRLRNRFYAIFRMTANAKRNP